MKVFRELDYRKVRREWESSINNGFRDIEGGTRRKATSSEKASRELKQKAEQ
jgi:hypothetical protein